MRIKILVLSLVITTLIISLSSTSMAYFTDTAESNSIFTVGNVQITSQTNQSDICTNMQKDNTCTETYIVTNTGPVNAYVRVRILVPTSLLETNSSTIIITTANDEFAPSANEITIGEEKYKEYISTGTNALATTGTYTPSLSFTYNLDSTATVEGSGTGESANLADFGIKVITEAIQAQGFASHADAFNAFVNQ